MISDPLARFSIKERLRSNNNSPSQPRAPQPQSPPQRQILAPEHYNYFLSTIEKQLKHESNTFRKIKKTIEEYKLSMAAKTKIKNAYEYSHQIFHSKPKKNHLLRTRPKFSSTSTMPFQQITNNENNQQNYQGNTSQKSRFSRTGLSSAKSSTFVRTPQHTVYDTMEQWGQKLQRQNKNQDIFLLKKGKVRKEGIFEVMGSKPKWGVFQSYRTHYSKTFKSPI